MAIQFRRPIIASVALVTGIALVAGCSSQSSPRSSGDSPVEVSTSDANPSGFRGTEFPNPKSRPAFTLTDTSKASYDFGQRTKGKTTLLYFGYTHCPDVCPAFLADIATALRGLPIQVRNKVDVVFVTVDPQRDTPEVMARYVKNFDADLTSKYIALTGDQGTIDNAQKLAGVEVATNHGDEHASQVLLITPDDQVRLFYTTGTSPQDIAHDLSIAVKG